MIVFFNSRLFKVVGSLILTLGAISIVAANELDGILQASRSLDDDSFCEVIKGIRRGIRGRKIAVPDSFRVWHKANADRSGPARSESLLLGIELGDSSSINDANSLVSSDRLDAESWRLVTESLSQRKVAGIKGALLAALDNPSRRPTAIRALKHYQGSDIASAVLSRISTWTWQARNQGLQLLASRSENAAMLCQVIRDGKLDPQIVPAVVIRQLRTLDDQDINHFVREIWGDTNSTPGEKRKEIRRLQNLLVANVLDQANLEKGHELARRLCLTCHTLHGEGKQIGPELTGAQRGDLYYVLHNIVHPSAQIDPSMRLSVFDMKYGRTYSGIVLRESSETLDLQTATEKQTLPIAQIESRTVATQSMMPDGILDALTNEEVRDLVGYLMHDKRTKAK